MPPFIGITTYGQNDERHFTLPREYVDSVRRAGGIPLLISPGETEIERLLSKLDGVILTGGGDIAPHRYGSEGHETIYMVDEERDSTELHFAEAAIAAEMPLFGICRGTQLMNIVFGGTLIEHLPDVVGDDVLHRLPPREPTEHPVTVDADSQLAEILGDLEFSAASWHHQAIKETAEKFKVVAHAPDGTIEAIECLEHRWLIGVQWHPELTAADDPRQQRLFDDFVAATKR